MIRNLFIVSALVLPSWYLASAQSDHIVEARLPTEALPAILGAPGEIWLKGMRLRSPLVAEQSVRIAGAIVRSDEKVSAAPMPLVLVGRLASGEGIPKERKFQAWCDISGGGKRFFCYQDLDGDGRLETGRMAGAINYNEPLTIAFAGPPAPLPTPMPYRAATTAELTTYRLVYESCGAGGLTEPRFLQRVRGAGGGSLDYGCTGVAKRLSGNPDGAGTMQVDRLVIEVAPKRDSAATRLVSGIPAGRLLDRITPGDPVVDLGMRPPYMAELLAAVARFAKPAFQFAEAPMFDGSATGPGAIFARGKLTWGYTGRVTKTTTITNLTGSRSIEAGTAVYGVPMGGGDGRFQPTLATTRSITWCAPRRDGERWVADCMPVIGNSAYTILKDLRPAFLVAGMSFDSHTIQAAGMPPVEEGPADFGSAVSLEYRLEKCKAEQATIIVSSSAGGTKASGIAFMVRADRDGMLRFTLGGGEIGIRRTETGCSIEMREGLKAGGSAMPARVPGGGDVRPLYI